MRGGNGKGEWEGEKGGREGEGRKGGVVASWLWGMDALECTMDPVSMCTTILSQLAVTTLVCPMLYQSRPANYRLGTLSGSNNKQK